MSTLADEPLTSFDPMQPFTRADALAAGLADRQLRGPRYRRLLHGVYVAAAVPDTPWLRARAALHVHPPGAVATHFSAARAWGAPVPAHPLEHVTVEVPQDRRHRQGLRCHIAAIAAADVRVVNGIRLSSPERMFVEMAAFLGLVELVVIGDCLVRQRRTSPSALVAYCAASQDPHVASARRAASYVRDRVDSPMETRLRMLLVLAGLPEPEVNVEIRDEHGTVLMRVDLCYPGVRLAIEYDGRHHVERERQWERDVERRDDLDDGWRMLTVTSKGIYREPEVTVHRVWRALRRRGFTGLRRPGDAWRAHFR
jgi:very-short-patch-repair endonuclease